MYCDDVQQVTLTPSPVLAFQPHPEHDGGSYRSLGDLQQRLGGEGYSGGIRLLKVIPNCCMPYHSARCGCQHQAFCMLQAACLVFWRACKEQGLEHLLSKNFTLSYETSIPRQAGLSGSSAIVCAALTCLLDFYGLGERCGASA